MSPKGQLGPRPDGLFGTGYAVDSGTTLQEQRNCFAAIVNIVSLFEGDDEAFDLAGVTTAGAPKNRIERQLREIFGESRRQDPAL